MRNLGMAAIKVGDNHEAARALEMAVKHNPQDKLLRPLLAVSQFSVGDYEHAARSFSLVADLALADPNMAYGWAFSLSRSNKLRQSASVLEKLTRQRLSAEMLVSVGRLDVFSQGARGGPCHQERA
jgi:Flp pilus assembly protein TadD